MTQFNKNILIFSAVIATGVGFNTSVWAAIEEPLVGGTAVETFSASYGPCTSPLTGGESEDLVLNKFNPSLGILTGVTLTLVSKDTIESEVIDLTTQNQAYNGATATLPVTMTALNGLTATATGVAGPFAGTANRPQYSTTVAGTSQVTTTTSANVAPADFILYEGAGQTFDVNVLVSDGTYSGSSAGNTVAFFGTGDSCGTVEVSYDYAPVPEPGTLAAGLGLLGYCGMRMVRRARAGTAV